MSDTLVLAPQKPRFRTTFQNRLVSLISDWICQMLLGELMLLLSVPQWEPISVEMLAIFKRIGILPDSLLLTLTLHFIYHLFKKALYNIQHAFT